jgi:hypothetical protein
VVLRIFACCLGAQIGHHCDPDAVAAKGVMHAVIAPHMRQKVECERHVSAPCVSDPDAGELREALGHEAMQRRAR